jgi:hypothetical protein
VQETPRIAYSRTENVTKIRCVTVFCIVYGGPEGQFVSTWLLAPKYETL